jgi:hypothetical protein
MFNNFFAGVFLAPPRGLEVELIGIGSIKITQVLSINDFQ